MFAVSMVGWGIITIGTGFVQSFHELLALRVLLGAFEASVIPSIVFTISMIWEPSAQAKPVSVYGRFHTPGHRNAVGKLMKLVHSNKELQCPGTRELYTPLRSTVDGTVMS